MLTPETLAEIEAYILKRLPQVLERDPNFATFIEGLLAEKFPRRDELARMLDELQAQRDETRQGFMQVDQRFGRLENELQGHRLETQQSFTQVDQRFGRLETELQEHRRETQQNFEQVDQRFEQADQRMDSLETTMRTGFDQVNRSIDRLGARWGIRNEKVFRQTMRELLEKSFGAQIQERYIRGEQFDCVIIHGDHILIELTASVAPSILDRLRRKRQLYIDETGITPARFLLVTGSIHSRRAELLRVEGFEVIEPEDTEE